MTVMIPCISLSVFLLYSLLHTIVSADISPGSTLQASNPSTNWTSPNNTFSLSFIAVGSNNPPLFAAAISYSGIPVWKAGGEAAVADSNSAFQFLSNGNLRLVNGSGSIVWESGTADLGITTASLDDSGNFALRNNSVTIWSSFDHPTDTILPTQNFTVEKTLRSGFFSFNLLSSGNLTLTWNNSIIYWNHGLNSTIEVNLTSPSLTFQSIGILSLNDPALSATVIVAYSSDYGEGRDVFRFVRLDSDGNLRIFSSTRGNGISDERWAAVLDQCQVFGWCGNMGICSYNDSKPICGCPSENFEFRDPNDSRKGCRRKMEIEDCPGNSTMLQMDHTLLLTYPPEIASQAFTIAFSPCRSNCLTGLSCLASTSLADGSGFCYLKLSDFVSGYQFPTIPSTSFIKVCGTAIPNSSPFSQNLKNSTASKIHVWVVAAILVGSLMGLVLLEVGIWWLCYRYRAKFGGFSAQYTLLDYASGVPVHFSYKELRNSTQGFKDKLGAGGFGAVYRGTLSNRTVVAVKQLEQIEHGEQQFRMEVATISISADTARKKFSLWAYKEFEKGNVERIVDKRLAKNDVNMEQVMRVIQVSFWCIQEQPSQRPMMGKVVHMLEGIMAIEKPPAPKTMTEGSVSGAALSTCAGSTSTPYSSSSFQDLRVSSSVRGRNIMRSPSLL
ncbi:hypothetical protein HHK36_004403 [Tetracentron sinense]|uniref:non-specific serine/threonine protein kinase n=1 Tax=Tetracentron sinense TaxID=13715 RepID=A0A835DT63_TETSI|nr:hypothetical protein HHK36_004403 [Tetracentron sinense]